MSQFDYYVVVSEVDPRIIGSAPGSVSVENVIANSISSNEIIKYTNEVVIGNKFALDNAINGTVINSPYGVGGLDGNAELTFETIPAVIIMGLDAKGNCRVKTASSLPPYTASGSETTKILTANSNGPIGLIDGVNIVLKNRVLIDQKGAASNVDCGIYFVLQPGDINSPWILKRSRDADTNGSLSSGTYTFVTEGNTGAGKGYIITTINPIVLDVTPFQWGLFSTTSKGITTTNLTAIGQQTGSKMTVGTKNTLMGTKTGFNLTIGQKNSSFGHKTNYSSIFPGQTSAFGYKSQYTIGSVINANVTTVNRNFANISFGYKTLHNIQTGYNEISIGNSARFSLVTGNTTSNGSIAVGHKSQFSKTSGTSDISIGYKSLYSLISSSTQNICIGNLSGRSLLSANNIAVGYSALSNSGNVSGIVNTNNIAIGSDSIKNILGQDNISIGSIGNSLSRTVSSNNNVFIGNKTSILIPALTSGENNVFIGTNTSSIINSSAERISIGYGASCNNTFGAQIGKSLFKSGASLSFRTQQIMNSSWKDGTTGIAIINGSGNINKAPLGVLGTATERNLSVGFNTFPYEPSGVHNIAFGINTMPGLTTGSNNTAVGAYSGNSIIGGNYNVFFGEESGYELTNGDKNTFIGKDSGYKTNSNLNTGIGAGAVYNIQDNNNISLGAWPFPNSLNGQYNIAIGNYTLNNATNINNVIGIGYYSLAQAINISNTIAIGKYSGKNNSFDNSVLLGYGSACISDNNVSIGSYTGPACNVNSVHIGTYTGYTNAINTDTVVFGYSLSPLRNDENSIIMGTKLIIGNNINGINGNNNIIIGGKESIDINNLLNHLIEKSTLINSKKGNSVGTNLTNIIRSISIGEDSLRSAETLTNTIAVGKDAGKTIITDTNSILLGTSVSETSVNTISNVGIGNKCLFNSTTSEKNIAIGYECLHEIIGDYNIAIGYKSLRFKPTGSYDVSIGKYAMRDATGTSGNIAIGVESSRYSQVTGCVAIGEFTLRNNTLDNNTICIGHHSGRHLNGAPACISIGAYTLNSAISNYGKNIAIGYNCLYSSSTYDQQNTCIGYNVINQTTGFNNTCLGTNILNGNIVGSCSNNTCIGYNIASNVRSVYCTSMGSNVCSITNVGILSFVCLGYAVGKNIITLPSKSCAMGIKSCREGAITNGTFAGAYCAESIATSLNNTFIGYSAGRYGNNFSNNVAVGANALKGAVGANISNTTAIGADSLKNNILGSSNTFAGFKSGENSSGSNNVVIGNFSQQINTADFCVSLGRNTLINNQSANNTTVGYNAGILLNAAANTIIGNNSGNTLTSGTNNTLIGKSANASSSSIEGCVGIGNNVLVTSNNEFAVALNSTTIFKTKFETDPSPILVSGSAFPLPALPSTYWEVFIGGVLRIIPLYTT